VDLLKRGYASKDELHRAISRDDPPTTGIGIVDVIVSRVRQKLAPHGIKLLTVHGLGYRFAEDARSKILQTLTAHGAGIVPTTTPSSISNEGAP
jgi:hypothetical protein